MAKEGQPFLMDEAICDCDMASQNLLEVTTSTCLVGVAESLALIKEETDHQEAVSRIT